MDRPTLPATRRQQFGSHAARRLRDQGALPSVLYGHQRETVHLNVPLRELEHMLHGGGRMLDLEIGGTVETAIVKDIQYDPMGDHLLHVDFARVAMDEKLTITVPVELHGLAKGVTSGGILDHLVQDIELTCLPGDLPELIRIEVADLDIGDIVHVRDLQAPPGVEFLHDPDAAVVTVHPPVAVEEEAPAEEIAPEPEAAEPEVIGGRREKETEPGEQPKQE